MAHIRDCMLALGTIAALLASGVLAIPLSAEEEYEINLSQVVAEKTRQDVRHWRRLGANDPCNTPLPEHSSLGEKGNPISCPARLESGKSCKPRCDEGYTLTVDADKKIIATKCLDGKITKTAACEKVASCVGPCITRESFEEISTGTWVFIFILIAAILFGCFYLCHAMGYFDKGQIAGGRIDMQRDVNDAKRVNDAYAHSSKVEKADRAKRGLGHLDE